MTLLNLPSTMKIISSVIEYVDQPSYSLAAQFTIVERPFAVFHAEPFRRDDQVAAGVLDRDLVLTGGRVANVYTGEWQETDVALFDGIIVGLGDYPGPRVDVTGRYLLPGFIDGHLHVESSMLTPRELARALLPLGTTTVVADPHEIANVWGAAGLDYLLSASEGLPVDFFFMLPSCVPASPLETSGAQLEADDLEPYRRHPRILGLAEMMNFPGLVAGDRAGSEARRMGCPKSNRHAPGSPG